MKEVKAITGRAGILRIDEHNAGMVFLRLDTSCRTCRRPEVALMPASKQLATPSSAPQSS